MSIAKAPEYLKPEHIAILLVLQKDILNAGKREKGLTRRQLAQLLVMKPVVGRKKRPRKRLGRTADDASVVIEDRPFKSRHTLNGELSNLSKLENLVETKPRYSGGASAHAYTIARETAIIWPSSAKIVVEIYEAGGQFVDKEMFLDRIEATRLKPNTESRALTKESIQAIINWAVEVGYLKDHGQFLVGTPRTDFENNYLRAIAAQCPVDSDAP